MCWICEWCKKERAKENNKKVIFAKWYKRHFLADQYGALVDTASVYYWLQENRHQLKVLLK